MESTYLSWISKADLCCHMDCCLSRIRSMVSRLREWSGWGSEDLMELQTSVFTAGELDPLALKDLFQLKQLYDSMTRIRTSPISYSHWKDWFLKFSPGWLRILVFPWLCPCSILRPLTTHSLYPFYTKPHAFLQCYCILNYLVLSSLKTTGNAPTRTQ